LERGELRHMRGSIYYMIGPVTCTVAYRSQAGGFATKGVKLIISINEAERTLEGVKITLFSHEERYKRGRITPKTLGPMQIIAKKS